MSATPDSADLSPEATRTRIAELAASQRTQAKYLPVSFSQQRLWFLDQLIPGNAFYNEHTSFRFSFPLNVAVFEQCLAEIVRRHDTLRTTFTSVDGQPVQVVAPSVTIPLPVIDLRGNCQPTSAWRPRRASRLKKSADRSISSGARWHGRRSSAWTRRTTSSC